MELAVKELTKAQQLMAQFWIVNKDLSESAREFSVGVMGAIEAALILLNSTEKNADSVKEPRKMDPKPDKKAKRLRIEDPNPNEPRKRRGGQSLSKVVVTNSPFGDGYQWRKYGQKNIQNSKHPRCYYRCVYAPYCEAKKQVRQKNSSYPPDYEVISSNEHSCIAQLMDSSPQHPTELESQIINSDPNDPNPISKEKENDAESSGSLGTDEIDWMPPLSPIDLHGFDTFAYDDPLYVMQFLADF